MWGGLPFSHPDYGEFFGSSGLVWNHSGALEDRIGITITSGSVVLEKNESNLIGISIGGGGKYCPCLYVVQVFDNTAASREGTLQSGDELTGVNNVNAKGKTKTEVAQLIQRSQGSVTIQYNKLHPDPKQGKSLDIALKKAKHRIVETMSSSTADAFGLSRAILCNDSLVKKLDELTRAEEKYSALIDHAKLVFKAFFDLIQVYKTFGDVFCSIGVRETQQSANEAFNEFGDAHRNMEKLGIHMLKRLKPILADLGTYLHKAIPDTRLTIKRYADVKFEYLSYCLKVKEMDDEEVQFAQLQEPLYRVETGNYEYRLVLRCRQDARAQFARLRSDVLVKLELLDSKHVQHLTAQLTRLVSVLADYHSECQRLMHGKRWFPIELDLTNTTLWQADQQDYDDEEEEESSANDDNLLDTAAEIAAETTDNIGQLGLAAANNNMSADDLLLAELSGLDLTNSCIGTDVADNIFPGLIHKGNTNTSRSGVADDNLIHADNDTTISAGANEDDRLLQAHDNISKDCGDQPYADNFGNSVDTTAPHKGAMSFLSQELLKCSSSEEAQSAPQGFMTPDKKQGVGPSLTDVLVPTPARVEKCSASSTNLLDDVDLFN